MPIKYVPFIPEPVEGQAVLGNFNRILKYKGADDVSMTLQRGMPLYEMEKQETVGENADGNMVIRGECVSACAYLKEQGIQVDLVYIDPPFASGADYAKKVYIRRNPKVAEAIAQAEQELDIDELKAFEEKMYGDVWDKEKYLNWMYENLMAIKSVMKESATLYVHLDWHIGHYVKILLDEVFGEDNFLNEIVWGYKDIGAKAVPYFKKKHDTIYVYQKSDTDSRVFNIQRQQLSESTIKRFGEYFNKDGIITYAWLKENNPGVFRKLKGHPEDLNQAWLDKNNGQPLSDWWDDISPLKSHFDEAVDYAEFHAEETYDDLFGGYAVSIDKFISDRVLSKIAEFNQKALLNSSAKKPYKPIEISEDGLELIEFLSVDCTATEGEWHSDSEIKIDKNGFVVVNGNKTKDFWDGKIRCEQKPLRLKIRNICGDETVWEVL